MQRIAVSIVIGLLLLCAPLVVRAQTPPNDNKGLQITPLRTQINLAAGNEKTLSLTVANRTNEPLNIQLFDKQFSVANYTYDYQFQAPQPNPITFGKPQMQLRPGESQKIPYTISVPKDMSPGGRYYTLFASATLPSNDTVTIQAASLLYLTIDGELQKTSTLESASIPRFVFGDKISYQLEARNTGNVHYFIYASGELHGATAKTAEAPVTYLLMPHTIRTIDGTIQSPILPGIYRATYGYRTDSSQEYLRTTRVFYIPIWSIAFTLILLLAIWHMATRRRKRQQKPLSPTHTTE